MTFRKIPSFNNIIIAILIIVGGITLGGCSAEDKPLGKPLGVEKTGSPETFTYVGEIITYKIKINKNNAFEINKINITDDLIKPCISPNEVESTGTGSCEVSYVITEEDMEAGEVTNTITVRGYKEGVCGTQGKWIQATDTVTITLEEIRSLELTKIGNPNWFYGEGEEITYTYTVENTGNVIFVGPVTVSDDLVDVVCPDGGLGRGASMECTASYTTTADDMAAGQVKNTATASADGISSNTETFVVLFEAMPELTLTKSAERSIFSYEGQLITYSFELTNTGNVPINSPFEPDDPVLEEWDCPEQTLEPGEMLTCTGVYYILQDDINTTLENCATVMGVYKGGQVTSNQACTEVLYRVPEKPPEKTACEKDPRSWECYCEKHPNHQDCGG